MKKKNDKFIIKIPKLKLFGYHGCYDEEKEKGQEFEVEMEITITPRDPGNFNMGVADLNDTFDYVRLEREIKKIFNKTRYDILEGLACEISIIPYFITPIESNLYSQIYSVSVIIRKNNPIGMSVPYVEIKYVKYHDTEHYWPNFMDDIDE